MSDRCLRVVGQGDAWVVSERVGVSSVGVSSVSGVSGVSDVSRVSECRLTPVSKCLARAQRAHPASGNAAGGVGRSCDV